MKSSRDLVVLAAALVAQTAFTGCGDTKCTMDTECPLPQVCVAGACEMRAQDGVIFDTGIDTDPFDVIDGADIPGDNPDSEVPTDVETDDGTTGPCTPAYCTNARTIFGSMSVSCGIINDPDNPQLVTANSEGTDQVWVMGRIVSGSSDVPKLAYRRVDPRTGNAMSDIFTFLGSIELDNIHPSVAFSSGIATVFPDIPMFSGNQMMRTYLELPPPWTAPVTTGFTGTGLNSSDPALTASATEMFSVWREDDGLGMSTLAFGRADTAGTELGLGTAAGDNTEDLGQPELVFNGTGYGLAYVVHAGVSADRVEFVELGADGAAVPGSNRAWTVEAGNTLPLNVDQLNPSRPSLAWNGTEYALAYEESGTTSHLHLKIISLGGTDVPHELTLEGELATQASLTVTERQEGLHDVVWNGENYGMLWVHEDTVTGAHLWFFELDEDGIITTAPYNLNSSATSTYNPTITWINMGEWGYYVFAWNEFSSASGVHVLYTCSYGCHEADD